MPLFANVQTARRISALPLGSALKMEHLLLFSPLIPIPLATIERQKIDTGSALWRSVLDATGQEFYFNGTPSALSGSAVFAP